MTDRPKLLGGILAARREELGYSLAQTVKRCEKPVSAAYLHKIEQGAVTAPSPFVLHELSHALVIPYPTLMEAAGYIYPSGHEMPKDGAMAAALLQADTLTPSQRESFDRFLAEVVVAYRKHLGGAS